MLSLLYIQASSILINCFNGNEFIENGFLWHEIAVIKLLLLKHINTLSQVGGVKFSFLCRFMFVFLRECLPVALNFHRTENRTLRIGIKKTWFMVKLRTKLSLYFMLYTLCVYVCGSSVYFVLPNILPWCVDSFVNELNSRAIPRVNFRMISFVVFIYRPWSFSLMYVIFRLSTPVT